MPVRLVVVLACALLAGCGGTAKPSSLAKDTRGASTDPPKLPAAWSAPVQDGWSPGVTSTLPNAWTVGDLLVLPVDSAVRGIRLRDGKTRWKTPVGPVCSIPPAPNARGEVAVLSGGSPERGCRQLIVLDARTGRLVMETPIVRLAGGPGGYGLSDVAVGDETVTVSNVCDAAYVFALKTGRRVATLPEARPAGRCLDGFAGDGETVVRAAKQDERFVAYDAASGRRTPAVPLRRAAPGVDTNPEIDRVVSSDRLIVDASVNGARYLRREAHGNEMPLGRGPDDSFPPTLTRVIHGRLAALQIASAREGRSALGVAARRQ